MSFENLPLWMNGAILANLRGAPTPSLRDPMLGHCGGVVVLHALS